MRCPASRHANPAQAKVLAGVRRALRPQLLILRHCAASAPSTIRWYSLRNVGLSQSANPSWASCCTTTRVAAVAPASATDGPFTGATASTAARDQILSARARPTRLIFCDPSRVYKPCHSGAATGYQLLTCLFN
jgi:hypothetical protein